MPIYILTEQMSEKIKCPERDSNPRHPDLMKGALMFPHQRSIAGSGHFEKLPPLLLPLSPG